MIQAECLMHRRQKVMNTAREILLGLEGNRKTRCALLDFRGIEGVVTLGDL